MKIIGIVKTSFTAKDGVVVNGLTLYVTEALNRGLGLRCDKIFLSDNKLRSLDFEPKIDQNVTVFYNRFGKVESLKLEDDLEDDFID